ncbi:MAG: glutamine-hydrolyzing carbamoyl-phosphate synthase small subunit [Anaerolineae bacterium]|nr:glutamine-hydrolyzing carbamoyl-phosphate synthase small subunit [Anaerolineae bacterium]
MRPESNPALLAVEDGTIFWGTSVGATGETFGELVFNTGMTGYQEVLTDPSYRGQIVVMTYPEIGIYGVNRDDVESERLQVAGFVVHRAVRSAFNQRATLAFDDYLEGGGVVAIEGVDTRALTRQLRTHGVMRGAIVVAADKNALDPDAIIARVRQSPSMVGRNLAGDVTTDGVVGYGASGEGPGDLDRPHIVVIDAGRKQGIVRDLMATGAVVTVVPYDVDAATVLSLEPDGVMVSNGPGDPEPLTATITMIRALLKQRVPVGGICLGHQLLGLAAGGLTYKMRFGHRGANHPIKELRTGQIAITTQNHGFALDPTSFGISWAPLDAAFEPTRPELVTQTAEQANSGQLVTMAELLPESALIGTSPAGFGPLEVTHLSLNDGTVEGLRLLDTPALSVQFHPEASPGPHDAKGFFEQFISMVKDQHA